MIWASIPDSVVESVGGIFAEPSRPASDSMFNSFAILSTDKGFVTGWYGLGGGVFFWNIYCKILLIISFSMIPD